MTIRVQRLSVVIPTKNAGQVLRECLESVAWADELIVVDMFSTDETQAICSGYPNCRVYEREDYIFGNVNFGFDVASGDWVMRLDSDERIPPELAAEIRTILADPPADVTGFEFWERPIILGRELRHGYGRKHYRKMMFRRSMARYPVRSEHEGLDTSGTWLRARQGYVHYNYMSVAQYLTKTNYYTDRDIERIRLPSKAPNSFEAAREMARAFYLYYIKLRGFLDGWVGFVDACMRALYQFTLWAKLRERWEREHKTLGEPEALHDVQISIVNTDNRELLRRCLGSLPGACDGLSWKAVVVDNASSDGSSEMVATQFPQIELMRNKRRLGFSANHNQVLAPVVDARSTRYILILNEDAELDPGSVRSMVAFCDAHPRIGAAGPLIRDANGIPQRTLCPFPTPWRELASAVRPGVIPRQPRRRGWLNGSCILLRTEALRDAGLLDERFFIFYEDADLGRRLWKSGWESATCELATALHRGHQSVARPAVATAMERQMLRSRYLYLRKHHGRFITAAVSPLVRGVLVLRAMKAWMRSLLAHDPSERSLAVLLLSLAKYSPRAPLPHEVSASEAIADGEVAVGTRTPDPKQVVAIR